MAKCKRTMYTDDPTLQCAVKGCKRKKKSGFRYCSQCHYSMSREMGDNGYFTDHVDELEARRSKWSR